MSYTKLHTPAVILSSHNVGEASKMFLLFTPTIGTVYAKAQGVRELRSRHRFALQTLSVSDISLVQGKGGWRITNATAHESLYALSVHDEYKKGVVVRVLGLLKRLIRGEENDELLFNTLTEGFTFLIENNFSPRSVLDVEILIVLRMLHILGYLKGEEKFISFLENKTQYSKEIVSTIEQVRSKAVREINNSLKASQL